MKKIIDRCKYWGQLLLLPVYGLSFLVPRDRKLWLFGSTFGRRFADNPRYLYLYVAQHQQELGIRPVWISHNRQIVSLLQEQNYEAYYYHSLKGLWMALRGNVYFFDNYSKDINYWQSGGAVKINLWHGVGNKRINYDNEHDLVRHPKNLWERWKYMPRRLSDEKPSHYILSTSPMMCEIFARAFQVPEDHVIEAGYPRNDILYADAPMQNLYMPEELQLQEHLQQWQQEEKKVLAYVPTFRPSESMFLQQMDLTSFNAFLQSQQMILICKLHPKSVVKGAFEQMQYSHIVNVSAEVDINSFLGQVDLLITDYSSVYSDYMLLDRPVVAFQYDYQEYSGDTRDAYFDFDEYMPEAKARTQKELEQQIQGAMQMDGALEKRRASCQRMFGESRKDACQKVVDIVQRITQ